MNWDALWIPLGGVIVAAFTYLSQRVAKKSDEKAKAIEAHGPEWQAMVKEIKDWSNDRLAERDERIDGLQSEVGDLRSELNDLKGKYWKAINYIRQLLSLVVGAAPDVPEAIVEDL